jgi:hypothetical protein
MLVGFEISSDGIMLECEGWVELPEYPKENNPQPKFKKGAAFQITSPPDSEVPEIPSCETVLV